MLVEFAIGAIVAVIVVGVTVTGAVVGVVVTGVAAVYDVDGVVGAVVQVDFVKVVPIFYAKFHFDTQGRYSVEGNSAQKGGLGEK